MGQYHHPVCIEAEEGLAPSDMDSGLKEGEQGFNRPSTPAAIVALVCANQDNLQIVDVAGGLFVMLCHPKRRGGGDIPGNVAEMDGIDKERTKYARLFKGVEDVKGHWRGGRILGTSEIRYEDWPTTEQVIERGTDISDKVLKYLVAISHY